MSELTPAERKSGIVDVFDRAAETYDQVGLEFFGPVAEALVAQTRPQSGERVLDVGCGRGASALRAAHLVGAGGKVLATDLAPSMVAGLRGQAKALPWLRVELGDAEDPPPGPWDVIQASLVLFFLQDIPAALGRYRQALSPSGRLGLTWFGPGDDSWDDVMGALVGSLPPEDRPPRDMTSGGMFSSVEAFEQALRERGFGDVRTTVLRVTLDFEDPAHWWAWTWSQGQRVLLERHEALGTLDRVRESAQPILEARARDGRLSWWTEIRVTLAVP